MHWFQQPLWKEAINSKTVHWRCALLPADQQFSPCLHLSSNNHKAKASNTLELLYQCKELQTLAAWWLRHRGDRERPFTSKGFKILLTWAALHSGRERKNSVSCLASYLCSLTDAWGARPMSPLRTEIAIWKHWTVKYNRNTVSLNCIKKTKAPITIHPSFHAKLKLG